jgi:transposase-like protein
MSVDDVARLFGVPERTARGWVRGWHQSQSDPSAPRVTLEPPQSGKGRTRYVVDSASLEARYPLLRAARAA